MTGAPDANALLYLNMVRNRSLATPATQAYTAEALLTIKLFLVQYLQKGELSLCVKVADGLIFTDYRIAPISRSMGFPAKMANASVPAASFTLGTPYTGPLRVVAIPGTDYKFLWPIPQAEVDMLIQPWQHNRTLAGKLS